VCGGSFGHGFVDGCVVKRMSATDCMKVFILERNMRKCKRFDSETKIQLA
jgi:hypothetical protein